VTTTTRRTTVAAAALLLAVALGAAACSVDDEPRAEAAANHDTTTHRTTATDGERIDPVAFHADMRKLWEDHVTWTRLYLVSAIADLPDVDAAAGRLLQNQDDIGEAVATFYGDEAGQQLSALLRDHILIAADLVAAAKGGDEAAVQADHDRWHANADEIAEFLASANPAWPEATLAEMMRMHLEQTLAEATARLNADWAADIAEYDRIVEHILVMADTLADGIVTQFPERFAG
jgi:hypothetical protein